jgi:hypothetical protein
LHDRHCAFLDAPRKRGKLQHLVARHQGHASAGKPNAEQFGRPVDPEVKRQ